MDHAHQPLVLPQQIDILHGTQPFEQQDYGPEDSDEDVGIYEDEEGED